MEAATAVAETTKTTKHVDKKPTIPTISFVITGFGPFGGVEENPTTVIVRKLDAYLREKHETKMSNGHRGTVADLVKEYIILETSAQAVNETMERIQNEHWSSFHDANNTSTTRDKRRILFLHLGVGRSEGFRLESCAYNEANFRIPDQRGYQPKEQAIVKSDPVGHAYQTSLDLKSLQEQMKMDFPGISTVISTDPGRFVCNYVYCKSLEVASLLSSKQEKLTLDECTSRDMNFVCESLFLHVPHFSIVSEEKQVAYVAGLVQNLAAAAAAAAQVP